MSDWVLVTGGSGGIGAATALKLAESSVNVVVHYSGSQQKADQVIQAITESGGNAVALQGDITKEAEVVRLFEQVDQLGTLVGLVNNAGVITPIASILEYSAERIERVFNVNVIGTFLCCREAIKRMSTDQGGGGGAIVNVSSTAARLGSPNEFIDYAASKGAVDTLTTGLSKEVAKQGVRVNSVRPGLIDTLLHKHAGAPDRCVQFSPLIPMGRAGQPEEVANTIAWLLSDSASYVTGAIVDVSGAR